MICIDCMTEAIIGGAMVCTNWKTEYMSILAIVVHKDVAVNVASSKCHVGGAGGRGLDDSVTGEAEWVWSTAAVCSSH